MDRLRDWLYAAVAFVARVHDELWVYNRSAGSPFTDKELHFIVIGAFGLVVLLVCYALSRFCAKRGLVGLLSWAFALSLVMLVCFAIEIGQAVTNTGNMELADIVYGVVGFLAVSCAVGALWLLAWLIKKLVQRLSLRRQSRHGE